jgi:hypothetical protein
MAMVFPTLKIAAQMFPILTKKILTAMELAMLASPLVSQLLD